MNFYIDVAPTPTEEMVEGNMSVTQPNDIAENIQDGMALTDIIIIIITFATTFIPRVSRGVCAYRCHPPGMLFCG